MKLELREAVEVLQKTPDVLRSLLNGLSNPWVQSNYGASTFSPFDVVGHLIQGEQTDWMVRVHIILEHGETTPFAPFDRYAMYDECKGKTITELLDNFA